LYEHFDTCSQCEMLSMSSVKRAATRSAQEVSLSAVA
jgi:hypothetical protein